MYLEGVVFVEHIGTACPSLSVWKVTSASLSRIIVQEYINRYSHLANCSRCTVNILTYHIGNNINCSLAKNFQGSKTGANNITTHSLEGRIGQCRTIRFLWHVLRAVGRLPSLRCTPCWRRTSCILKVQSRSALLLLRLSSLGDLPVNPKNGTPEGVRCEIKS